jgi:hypothetical protein
MPTLTEEQTRNDKRLAEIARMSRDFKPGHKDCPQCSSCLTTKGHICVPSHIFGPINNRFKGQRRRRGINGRAH